MIVGVSGALESAHEMTYLETDLNTGQCRDIAVKSATKLPLPESLSSGVSSSLQTSSQAQRLPGQTDSYVALSQSLLPEKSAAFGYHGAGNTQNVTASGQSTSGTTVVIGTHSGNPPVTGAEFPPVTDQKLSSDATRLEPFSGVYSLASSRPVVQHSLASSRPVVQQTASRPSDAGNRAERRLGPDAEGSRDDYQHRQVASSYRENADGMQQSSDRKQLAASVPLISMQVISLSF